MISAKNINFDAPTKIDPPSSTQENSNVEIKNNNTDNKDDKSAKDNVDPNGFVSLLGHVISNAQQQNATDSSSTPATPTQSDKKSVEDLKNSAAAVQLTDPSLLSSELIKPDLVQLPASNALKTGAEISQEAAPISDNHAVAWIDSTSFQSLSAPAGPQLNSTQPVIDNLVSNAKNTTDKPTIDTLTSDAAKNALGTKFTEDFMQTLKSSVDVPGVGGEKAPSTQKEIDNTSLLQNTQANTPLNQPTHATGQTKSLEIPVNINNPGWGDKFAEQISWLGHQEIKSAVIKIHPEELGPLEISVKVDKDSASVNIISHSSHVRDIVDQAIPRLRDMMAEQGLNLSDVHVNSDRNSGQFSQQNNNDQQGSSSNSADEEVQLVTNIKKRPQGLIDYFA